MAVYSKLGENYEPIVWWPTQPELLNCAMNKARAGEIPPSPPETTAWDVVDESSSDVTVCEVEVLKPLSPPAI